MDAAAWGNTETSFEFQWGSMTDRPRWDTSCIAITYRILSEDDGAVAHAGTCAPPWNLVCHLWREMQLYMNDIAVINQTVALAETMHARILMRERWADLDKRDWVMGPMMLDGSPDNYLTVGADAGTTFAAGSAARARSDRWVGAASNGLYHTIHVPLWLLADLVGAPTNLRKVKLMLRWSNLATILEHANNVDTDYIHIEDIHIELDTYFISAREQSASVEEKQVGQPDLFVIQDVSVRPINAPTDAATVTNMTNADGVAFVQFAKGIRPAGAHAYTSLGQTGVFNLTGIAVRTSSALVCNADVSTGLNTVQLRYGANNYPVSPIDLIHGAHGDFSGLYAEVQRAKGPCCEADYRLFRATMPFIFLKPFTENGVHRSGTTDMTLNFVPAAGFRGEGAGTAYMIVFRNVAWKIESSGTVKQVQY